MSTNDRSKALIAMATDLSQGLPSIVPNVSATTQALWDALQYHLMSAPAVEQHVASDQMEMAGKMLHAISHIQDQLPPEEYAKYIDQALERSGAKLDARLGEVGDITRERHN
jgi:hypothetical protein